METMMDEMVKKYPVDGVPTSLKDLGYLYVGLDDHVRMTGPNMIIFINALNQRIENSIDRAVSKRYHPPSDRAVQ